MTLYRRILIAYDDSDTSKSALKTAEKLAKINDSTLTVVYVENGSSNTMATQSMMHDQEGNPPHLAVNDPITDNPDQDYYYQPGKTPDQIIQSAESLLSNMIEADFQILSGKPSNQIIDYSKENGIDLIVVGNRGISGVKKLFMGSVSKKVVNEADCQVLVIK